MRVVGVVFSSVVTLSFTALALTYVPRHIGQQRIYVQDHSGSDPALKGYRSYGYPGDTARTATDESDPYHQRYYSESEGWSYYSLPSSSSVAVRGQR